MSLDAVSRLRTEERSETLQKIFENERNLTRWMEHPSSSILHHEASCCEEARLWFLAYARSMEIGAGSQFELKAPTWLSKVFEWGPTEWPISWCQVVKEKYIDCGVFAVLAREVFKAQGHEVHPAQVLINYNATCTGHWQQYWDKRKKSEEEKKGKKPSNREVFPWIGTEIVYHEICLLEMPDGTARFYDSTWGHWYLPQPRVGFGAVLALRSECSRLLRWGGKTISCGEWVDL